MKFQDKVVLVTGAGSGLGEEIAMHFAKEGASLILNDIDQENLERVATQIAETGRRVVCVPGDVSDPEDVNRTVEMGIDAFQQIDILVNNAGIADTIIPTIEQDIQHWQKVIDIHLRGSYLFSKTVGAHMIKNGSGKVINISSIVGMVGLPGRNAYGAAKAGMIMFTRSLASEWARYGINVNAVAPGYIKTPLVRNLLSKTSVVEDKLIRRIPFGKLGEPSDIAHAVLFLSSDQAAYITGACLPVDGGWTAFGGSGDANEL
ncbi:glucose 1-dehydrogenase [Brevibacillus choshinensis]|uniref:SDR family NAD(P)-dependent oxidoreductase n=1 Tax=Brevibacillus choshinensis TaxID=54911 RepID=UPI002E1EAB15|nr:glucose 1-dehydrogenase [Brevibacillus choshinensis]MED4584612.1 glucose 1-dehydrogenase [Brevibacillus choshinensis]MED4753253.1 glucose 1-dehydrogenase [Brevibacillus choshinensis]MED4782320.1 glucose 1-dehydrogenase [Brevibacillus choshinensis]